MKTVVLDDDPTGTQSASHVRVLLETSVELLIEALRHDDSVYVLTNTRAIAQADATALLERVRDESLAAADALGEELQFVLRGDSTLRGHVFPETDVFVDDTSVILFVPAFPEGGRTTRDGVHFVRLAGVDTPAHETEFAADPVFPFASAVLVDYVREKSGRIGVPVPLEIVRDGGIGESLIAAAPGQVVLPDILTDDDIALVAGGVRTARAAGVDVVVRSASPLAAALAGVVSDGLMPHPLVHSRPRTLVVCGSHTDGATRQLAALEPAWGAPITIDTGAAMVDPAGAALDVAGAATAELGRRGVVIVASERTRAAEHNTLVHGERVMDALTRVVREVAPMVDVVVSKGGITSAEVARIGLGARSATVLGQVLPGVSVWSLVTFEGREMLYVVVPGNVGEAETLADVFVALGLSAATP